MLDRRERRIVDEVAVRVDGRLEDLIASSECHAFTKPWPSSAVARAAPDRSPSASRRRDRVAKQRFGLLTAPEWIAASPARSSRSAISAGSSVTSIASTRNPTAWSWLPSDAARTAAARRAIRACAASGRLSGSSGAAR